VSGPHEVNYRVAILEAACKVVDIEQIQLVSLCTWGHSSTAARSNERPDVVTVLEEFRGDRSAHVPGGAGYCDPARQLTQVSTPRKRSQW
jgi:hypothetical protein